MHLHECRDCGAEFVCHGFPVWLEDRHAKFVRVCLAYHGPQAADQCRACQTGDPVVRSLEELDRDECACEEPDGFLG